MQVQTLSEIEDILIEDELTEVEPLRMEEVSHRLELIPVKLEYSFYV
jgi:hypothetical protein